MKRYIFVKFNGKLIEKSELPAYYEELKKYRARARRKETIKKHIRLKKLKWYVTITFDPNKKNRFETNREALTKLLRRWGIEYYLIAEFHQDGAIHYHGFLSHKDGVYQHHGFDRRGVNCWVCKPLEKNFGFNRCYKLVNNRTINYVVKYATKQGNKAYFSRIKLNDFEKKCVDLFGNLVKFI